MSKITLVIISANLIMLLGMQLIIPSTYMNSIGESHSQAVLQDCFGLQSLQELKEGEITTVAGNFFYNKEGIISKVEFEGIDDNFIGAKGILATSFELNKPSSLGLDNEGNLYIGDAEFRIFRVDKKLGSITPVAGNGHRGYSGDGGPATRASLSFTDFAMDGAGNIFIVDRENSRIRRVDSNTGIITTVAGNGLQGVSGDGGPAVSAKLGQPVAIVVDRSGDIFIAESLVLPEYGGGGRIRRIDGKTGIINTIAGRPTELCCFNPIDIMVDKFGNLLIADCSRPGSILLLDISRGALKTLAGGFGKSPNDGELAVNSSLSYPYYPNAVDIDSEGNIFIAGINRVQRIDSKTGIISTVAGTGNHIRKSYYSPDGILATSARFDYISDVKIDGAGNMYIADCYNNLVRRVDVATGILTTVAGSGSVRPKEFCPATDVELHGPISVAIDPNGNLYISESLDNNIRRVDAGTGIINTIFNFQVFANVSGYRKSEMPCYIAVGNEGNLYISDGKNHWIFKINTKSLEKHMGRISQREISSGLTVALLLQTLFSQHEPISLVLRIPLVDVTPPSWGYDSIPSNEPRTISFKVGTGKAGFSGDGSKANFATLNAPAGVAVDSNGNLFIVDTNNYRIRRVDATTEVIETVIKLETHATGEYGSLSHKTTAPIVYNLAVDSKKNLYIADSNNHRILRVDAKTGITTTVAGNGKAGLSGDGGPAEQAGLNFPTGIAVDSANNLFIADTNNHRIRRVDINKGLIYTVVGSGPTGADKGSFSGDGGPAIGARLNMPQGVAIDKKGNLFIADTNNHVVRFVKGIIRM
jgi:sugar lactone lactonase YvrE